jgi:mannose-6-phosphate isomerase-like protein (cupin superfamily)
LITKLMKDHDVVHTPNCGELREILTGAEYSPSIAIAIDIRPTTAHFHRGFDEIYFVLDGDLVLQTYDPDSGKTTERKLAANELCVVTKGVHHGITAASAKNRLCVIAVPAFDPADEHISDILAPLWSPA